MSYIRPVLLALTTLSAMFANAQNTAPVYDEQQGILILPRLDVGSEQLYVELKQLPGTLDFRVDGQSIRSASSFVTLPNGNGTPNAPSLIDFNSANDLSSNIFYNYFHLNAIAGQQLIVNVQLNKPLNDTQKARCASNPGYDTQIRVYDANMQRVGLVCGENLSFIVPVTGKYVLHFSYGSQSAGAFNAALL